MQLTATQVRYLLAAYQLQERGVVRLTPIADRLQVSKPSVHRMISQLKEFGLVIQEGRNILRLTEKGMETAYGYEQEYQTLFDFFTGVLEMEPGAAGENAAALLGSESGTAHEMCRRIQSFYDCSAGISLP